MAFFRNLIRYIGLLCILAPYIASGLNKILVPSQGAAALAKSNFPRMLAPLNIVLSAEDYIYVIQGTGVIFLSFSLFILLGVGRSFFSFLMAVGTLIIAVAFFVNLDDPRKTSEDNLIKLLHNVALSGAFLFVSASGHRSQKYVKAHEKIERQKKVN